MWLSEKIVGGRLLADDGAWNMADYWTLFWIPLAVALAAAAIIGIWKWIWPWARKRVHSTGIVLRIRHWLVENKSYALSGFRLLAVLDCDGESGRGRAHIGKWTPALPRKSGQVRRLKKMQSRPFQRRKTFAWQVYAECVPFCAQHGWQPLEIHGWSRPDLVMPMNQIWTVLIEQGRVVISAGWTPIPSLPKKRATAYNSFNQPPQP